MPREGLLDPQGRAVGEMLEDNGYKVGEVRVGKVIELEIPEDVDAELLAQKYLINPLIEDFVIEEVAPS
jgi:phosphoribosylformylglycinamidine synthase